MQCPKCGNQIRAGLQLCTQCGTKFGTPPVPPRSSHRPGTLACSRCHRAVTVLTQFTFDRARNLCGDCSRLYQTKLVRFREAFQRVAADGLLTDDEWNWLLEGVTREGLSLPDALGFIRDQAVDLLQRYVTYAASDGHITDDEERRALATAHRLAIPEPHRSAILQQLTRVKSLRNIREGKLPTVTPTIHLSSGEICHLETEAHFQKETARGVLYVPGRFSATNKKLRFLSPAGGVEIDWRRVSRIIRDARGVHLELTVKRGNGYYIVPDPLLTEAVLNTVVKVANRQMLPQAGGDPTRHIPQDVKNAVWQRDQGRCVQCHAADYLEFDHIIPHSKGGANTVGNVQLLCRRCNNAKSDKL